MARGATALPLTPDEKTDVVCRLIERRAAFLECDPARLLAALLWETTLVRLTRAAEEHPSDTQRVDALCRCFSNEERYQRLLSRAGFSPDSNQTPLDEETLRKIFLRWLALIEEARSEAHLFTLLCADPAAAHAVPSRDGRETAARINRTQLRYLAGPLWRVFHARLLTAQIRELGRLGRALFLAWQFGFALSGRTGPALWPLLDSLEVPLEIHRPDSTDDGSRAPP